MTGAAANHRQNERRPPSGGLLLVASVRRTLAAWLHLADARVPVGERGTRSTAASERRRGVLRERAGLTDVLRGNPDVVSVDHGGAVVAPARTGWVRSIVERIAAETVSRAKAGRGHLDRADAGGVDRREGRARIEVAADQGKGHHAVPVWPYGDRRVGHIVLFDRQVSLVFQCRPAAGRRVHNEPLDSRPSI